MSAPNGPGGGPHYIPFGPNANCTLDVTCGIEQSVYQYRPSLAANGSFIALYGLALIVHLYLGFRWRAWWFTACMILGCVDEIVGYIGRIILWQNPFSFIGFMIQIVMVSTGPVFYTAAIYVTLARTIESFAPSLSRFQPKLFYWVFIPLDIVSLVLQAAGGALSTTSSGSSQAGVNISLAGLAFQVFTMLAFCGFFADYLIRYWRRARTPGGGNDVVVVGSGRTKLYLGFLALSIILILARCAYRVDELSEGYTGDLIHNEPLFIGLEGVLIIVACYCLMIGHPGFVFNPDGTIKGVRGSGGYKSEESGDAPGMVALQPSQK